MCVTDPWAHMSLVHSILSLKLGVTPIWVNQNLLDSSRSVPFDKNMKSTVWDVFLGELN